MKILLTKDVAGLGRAGDIKEVSDGHARNFLIPRHLALPATSGMLQKVQKEEREQQEKLTRERERFEKLKKQIESRVFVIRAKAQKEHLFAAVREKEIASVLSRDLNLPLTASEITVSEPIKSLGSHSVQIRLAGSAPVKVNLKIEQL